jgi:DNA-binding response OmpR family regulator
MDDQFRGTVLIIKDNISASGVLNQQLETQGFQVLLASDSMAAKQLFDSNELQAVLLDLSLSEENGIELLKEMNTKKPYIPVIVLSTNDDLVVIQKTYEHGAIDYFIKPIHEYTLEHRLKSYIENNCMN